MTSQLSSQIELQYRKMPKRISDTGLCRKQFRLQMRMDLIAVILACASLAMSWAVLMREHQLMRLQIEHQQEVMFRD